MYLKSAISIFVLIILLSCAKTALRTQSSASNFKLNKKNITIAIIDFKNIRQNTHPLMEVINGYLSSQLLKSSQIKVLERKKLKSLLDEIGLSMSGLVDSRSAVKAGKLIGAQYMVLGSIVFVRNKIMINARVVSVETTEILVSTSVRGDADKGLDLVEELSGELSDALRKSAKVN